MRSTSNLMWKQRTPPGLEVRYERSFLLDLKRLAPAAFAQIWQFVFEEFYKINQLQELPEFRQLYSSEIFPPVNFPLMI
ncbi:MAG: hypothetical protein HC866_27195 [Leptolyngbyaceae cyanobacterium RU_5_1]|nr:hypothetical protein [Leptolyngbyaceae cyanobacterium RU_5_1]